MSLPLFVGEYLHTNSPLSNSKKQRATIDIQLSSLATTLNNQSKSKSKSKSKSNQISISSLSLIGSYATSSTFKKEATNTTPKIDVGIVLNGLVDESKDLQKEWKNGVILGKLSAYAESLAKSLGATVVFLKNTDNKIPTLLLPPPPPTKCGSPTPSSPAFVLRLLFLLPSSSSPPLHRTFPTIKNCSSGSPLEPTPNYNSCISSLFHTEHHYALTYQLHNSNWSSAIIPPPPPVSPGGGGSGNGNGNVGGNNNYNYNNMSNATSLGRDLVFLTKSFLAGHGLYSNSDDNSNSAQFGLTGFEINSIVNYFVRSNRVKLSHSSTVADGATTNSGENDEKEAEEEKKRRRGEAASRAFVGLLREIGHGVDWLGEGDVGGEGESDSDSEEDDNDKSESESDDDDVSTSTTTSTPAPFDTSPCGATYTKSKSTLSKKTILITPLGLSTPTSLTLSSPHLLSLAEAASTTPNKILRKYRRSTFGPVLLSSDLTRNYLHGVTRGEMQAVVTEARRAHKLLIDTSLCALANSFEKVFLSGRRRNLKYRTRLADADVVVRIVVPLIPVSIPTDNINSEFNKDLSELRLAERKVENVLGRGLGRRIVGGVKIISSKIINSNSNSNKRKANSNLPPSAVITISTKANLKTCSLLVQKGPKPSTTSTTTGKDKKATKFKEFWGPEKAQTRRFKTGEITLAVVWEEVSERSGAERLHPLLN